MTREEAIKNLELSIGTYEALEIGEEELKMAIEALKENERLARTVNEASDLLRKKRPHGEWIEKSKFDRLCKNCGQQHIGDKRFANFCPNCGADMRKESEAE